VEPERRNLELPDCLSFRVGWPNQKPDQLFSQIAREFFNGVTARSCRTGMANPLDEGGRPLPRLDYAPYQWKEYMNSFSQGWRPISTSDHVDQLKEYLGITPLSTGLRV
jgi:hypothetical protein